MISIDIRWSGIVLWSERIMFTSILILYSFENRNKIMTPEESLLQIVNQTKTKQVTYSGKTFEGGYHDVELRNGNIVKRQRNCKGRLSFIVKYISLENKTILDIGTFNGMMLHHALEYNIKKGIGIDNTSMNINTCALHTQIIQNHLINYHSIPLIWIINHTNGYMIFYWAKR